MRRLPGSSICSTSGAAVIDSRFAAFCTGLSDLTGIIPNGKQIAQLQDTLAKRPDLTVDDVSAAVERAARSGEIKRFWFNIAWESLRDRRVHQNHTGSDQPPRRASRGPGTNAEYLEDTWAQMLIEPWLHPWARFPTDVQARVIEPAALPAEDAGIDRSEGRAG